MADMEGEGVSLATPNERDEFSVDGVPTIPHLDRQESSGPSNNEVGNVPLPPHKETSDISFTTDTPTKDDPTKPRETERNKKWPWIFGIVVVIVLGIVGIAVAVLVVFGPSQDNTATNPPIDDSKPGESGTPTVPTSTTVSPVQGSISSPTLAPAGQTSTGGTPMPTTTIERSFTLNSFISGGQSFKCGIQANDMAGFVTRDSGNPEGFEVDLCKAVAAAIFGPSYGDRLSLVPVTAANQFSLLNSGVVDMLTSHVLFTMENMVSESTTGKPYALSVPYLHDFLGMGGLPSAIDCAARRDTNSTGCANTKICVVQSTMDEEVLMKLFPIEALVPTPTLADLYANFAGSACNVIAGGQFGIGTNAVRRNGYSGTYLLSTEQLAKHPYALVTRSIDPVWSDFVNWVLRSLMQAEESSITQSFASLIDGSTDVFGVEFSDMFKNAITAVGNYGELYLRHLGSILPRQDINLINDGTRPLIYSHPFGNASPSNRAVPDSPTLRQLRELNQFGLPLRCGVTKLGGFGDLNTTTQEWSGLDVDVCRAISAALFDGKVDVEFVELPGSERWGALASQLVQIVTSKTTLTFDRDAGIGVSFTQPTYYDGLSYGGIPPFGSCADRNDLVGECAALKICVDIGTTTIDVVRTQYQDQYIVPTNNKAEQLSKVLHGECNALASDRSSLIETVIRGRGYDGPYELGSRTFSEEPLTVVTRQEDPIFAAFVYWVVEAMFYAEEQGITQATASDMPLVSLFGSQYTRMFEHVIATVGNYGEIYARNIDSPRTGGNILNGSPNGPQHFVPPGLPL